MSHQPFETWILDNESLKMEDRRALQAHLETCDQCQKLDRKWLGVQRELRARKMISPAPGFAQRWQAGLAERRAREHRKQGWIIFMACLAGAVFVLLILAGYVMMISSPSDWLASIIRYVSSSLDLYSLAAYLVQTWLSRTPLAINIALWIYLAITLCLLSLAWVFALWRTSIVGVRNK